MVWTVTVAAKTEKRVTRLPGQVQKALALLIADIEAGGPVRGDWPNYSRLPGNRHHCHLKKCRPTYVAVWEDMVGEIKVIEVIYAGTHEKAPY
jgi:hypothetical protein